MSLTVEPNHAGLPLQATASAPVSTCHLGYLVFLILGLASLFPWNMLVKNDYFRTRFAELPSFLTWVSAVFMIASLATLTALVLWPARVLHRPSSPTAIKLSLLLNGAVFFCLAILPSIDALSVRASFAIVLALAALSGICSGLIQSGLFSLVAQFPAIYVQAISVGQGLAGVFSSISYLLTVHASKSGGLHDALVQAKDSAAGACVYFLTSSGVAIGSLLAFLWLQRRALYRCYYQPDRQARRSSSDKNGQAAEGVIGLDLKEGPSLPFRSSSGCADLKGLFKIFPAALYPWSIFVVSLVTFAAFPAFFVNIVSSAKRPSAHRENLFSPAAFLLYDAGDCIGKWLPGMISFAYIGSHRWAAAVPFLRIVLILLLMMCQFRRFDSRGQPVLFPGAPRLIQSDVVYFSIVLVFGLTNGYAGCLLLVKAPETVAEARLKGTMGQVMALFLGLGLAVGPLLSFGLMALLCECNPF